MEGRRIESSGSRFNPRMAGLREALALLVLTATALGGVRTAQAGELDCSAYVNIQGNTVSFDPDVRSVNITTPNYHARFREWGNTRSGQVVTGPEGSTPALVFRNSCTEADLAYLVNPPAQDLSVQDSTVQFAIEATLSNSPRSDELLSNTPGASE